MKKEILERYYNGEASEEEHMQVKQWLELANIDVPMSTKLSDENKEAIRKNIWSEIVQVIDKPAKRRRGIPVSYQVAASVTIAIMSIVMVLKYSRVPGYKTHASDQLSIREASYNTNNRYHLNQSGTITFCGDMEISNKGQVDYPVFLKTNCTIASSLKRKFLSKKGHSYIAVLFEHKNKEILVIDKEELRRETQPLPRRLITKLTKEFSI